MAEEIVVRMGELAVAGDPGVVLVSLGLGSCIGLALLDRRMGIAGLAHIVLPEAAGEAAVSPRKFADRAVPALVAGLEGAGARRVRLRAVLVGGASIFSTANAALEVGPRNEAAVRAQLRALRIPVAAAATGGGRGRTIRVRPDQGTVTVREAGGATEELVGHEPLEVSA